VLKWIHSLELGMSREKRKKLKHALIDNTSPMHLCSNWLADNEYVGHLEPCDGKWE
jgi:hypothetical protein